ncbi:MAG: glycosyltransferase family 39 protein [Nanoarchaeota archaeon]|nr:glycosyltransferase family 39 protein [Nanoarchaeota archaeon]
MEEIKEKEEVLEQNKSTEETVLEKRKERLFDFFKNLSNKNWIGYVILIFILWAGTFIRTRNLPLLQKKFLLALDPYVFYRYAAYIVEHGRLMAIDYMRNVPLGLDMSKDATLLAYVIAWMYKFLHFFDKSITLWFVDVMYPVIFFVLAMIVFFLLVRRLFDYRVALFSVAFLSFIPSFLYRSMAGFSDKEALGIFLMFLTFYFFVVGWQSQTNKGRLIFGVLSGLSTALMGLAWGGVSFISLIIPSFIFIEILFNKLKKGDFMVYTGWVIIYFFVLSMFTSKYGGIIGMLSSWTFSLSLLVWFIALMSFLFPKFEFFEKITSKFKRVIPGNLVYIIFSLILVIILIFATFGPSFIVEQGTNAINEFLIHPAGTNRFQLTVAESHQPYFLTWIGQFGWLFFWLFFAGSVALFWDLIKPLVKYRIKLTVVYFLFICGFIFSRYSNTSLFNGENFISMFVYAGSGILLILSLLYFYLKAYRKDQESFLQFKDLDKKYIFLFVWFIMMVVAGRTAIRLLFVFSPVACFLTGYLLIRFYDWSKLNKEKMYRYLSLILIVLICYLTLFNFVKDSYNQAKYTGPSYNQQWQSAGEWVEGNTPEEAVFAHWWDYGYWVQTGWNRSTVTDGGNMIGYWNYLLGRHFLTGQTTDEALEFLKTHEVTHALMISDEIGKYGAYSSIGGDENNDRLSYIPTFVLNMDQIQETRNGTVFLYQGGFGTDEDIMYQGNLIPQGSAFVGALILEIQNIENGTAYNIKQPSVILVYRGQQIKMNFGCVYFNNEKYEFENSELGGCFRVIPTIQRDTFQFNQFGAGLFVSEKVERTVFARLFLFNEELEGFNLVYDDSSQMPLALLGGSLIGPLKIWELDYPDRINVKPEYLETEYPREELYKLD